ncbi:MAG: hypothetical protein ACI8RT_000158 [Candidatus Azotimanducaceae bacterium]|jgi:hypothetical protein|tara:strand:+ start:668 stop:775 length:108 start_codon:yes stop_codon:yes gene_type:complete
MARRTFADANISAQAALQSRKGEEILLPIIYRWLV